MSEIYVPLWLHKLFVTALAPYGAKPNFLFYPEDNMWVVEATAEGKLPLDVVIGTNCDIRDAFAMYVATYKEDMFLPQYRSMWQK